MAGKKQALGLGLDALFGDVGTNVSIRTDLAAETGKENRDTKPRETIAAQGNAVLFIDIDDIKPNSMQPRQFFDPETIDDLAASIEKYGILQPVILQKSQIGYELVAGERRWRAARKAGLKEIPAILREVTEEENALFAIIENMQREDLNTIEEATAYHAIIQRYGLTQEVLARAVGKSRPHIANTLRTLGMQVEIVDFLRQGSMTLGHANALGSVKDARQQLQLAKKIVKNGLSVREAERLAAQVEKKTGTKRTQSDKTVEIRVVEQELTSATGVRVKIKGNGEKGSVELQYFDRQGLEEIIDLLRNARAEGK